MNNEIEVPPLIAEACEYCLCKEQKNPLARCMAYGGYYPCIWLSAYDVPYKCLSFIKKEKETQKTLNRLNEIDEKLRRL